MSNKVHGRFVHSITNRGEKKFYQSFEKSRPLILYTRVQLNPTLRIFVSFKIFCEFMRTKMFFFTILQLWKSAKNLTLNSVFAYWKEENANSAMRERNHKRLAKLAVNVIAERGKNKHPKTRRKNYNSRCPNSLKKFENSFPTRSVSPWNAENTLNFVTLFEFTCHNEDIKC